MDRFRRILVYLPVDQPVFSVARTADELARQNDAKVTVIDVVADEGMAFWKPKNRAGELQEALVAASEQRLKEISQFFDHAEPEIIVATGVDFIEVIGQVYRGGHDIVMVGSHPRVSAATRLDPTLTHLLRKCPVPVWVVDDTHRDGDVLAAVGPEFDAEAQSLNKSIVEMASSLAARKGVRMHLVHVWRVFGESLLFSQRVSMVPEEIDSVMESSESTANDLVARLKHDVPAARDARVHLLHGEADVALVGAIEEIQPSVVVMGTVARKGIPGMIIGNTAERTLLTVDASLLAVKPAWFESPVPPPTKASNLALR